MSISAVVVAMAMLAPPSPEEVALKEQPIELDKVEAIDTASIQPEATAQTVQRPAGFSNLPQELHQFRMEFLTLKPKILQKEKGYIFISETPEEAKKDLTKSKKLLRDTKKWVDRTRQKMDKQLNQLDEKLVQAEHYCESAAANQTQCEKLADPLHYYEGSVSTYVAMMEVMQERYEEAAEALK